jgi:hypothetical protein
LDEYFQYSGETALTVRLPAPRQLEIAGFRVILQDPASTDETYVQRLEPTLRHFRARAQRVLPWLVKHALPLIVKYKESMGEAAGTYNHDGTISLQGHWAVGLSPEHGAKTVAHEMGHHVWNVYLSDAAHARWDAAITGNYGDLDLEMVLAVWPAGKEGESRYWIEGHSLRETDPTLYLQIYLCMHPPNATPWFQSKADVERLIAEGTKTVPVPLDPITVYATKNREEAFCEALGMLVAYGPRAVPARARFWLEEILPEIRIAASRRVVGRFSMEVRDS